MRLNHSIQAARPSPLPRHRLPVWFFLGLTLVSGAFSVPVSGQAPRPEDQEGRIIHEIKIQGNERVSAEAVKAKLLTREGNAFNSSLVSKDIKALTQSDGYFLDVNVKRIVLPDGTLSLLFKVKEKDFVEKVQCFGAFRENAKEVLAEVRLKGLRFVDRSEIRRKARRLEGWYRKKGYHHVMVRTATRPGPRGGTLVYYLVDEGPLVKVERVVFRGNRSLDSSLLLKVMQTEESGFLNTGIYDREVAEADCIHLQEYYRHRGFQDARVDLLDVLWNGDNSAVTLVVGVDEGDPYLVDCIEIEGNRLFTDEELLMGMEQKVGERFDGVNITLDMEAILFRYREQAYLDVQLKEDLVYRLEAPRIKVVYRISEGEKIRVGQIKVYGNEITQDKVILRTLSLAPGDYLNIQEVQRSINRLRSLGYFEPGRLGVAEPEFRKTASQNVQDMILRFREGRTGRLRMALGVGSDRGLSGIFSFTKENFDIADLPRSLRGFFAGEAFSGGGQTLILQAAPGTRVSNFQARFIEPRVFDTPWIFDSSLYRIRYRYDAYYSDRTGFRVNLGRHLDRDLGIRDVFRVNGALRYEVVDFRNSEDDVDITVPPPALREEGTLRIHSFELTGRYASWDDPLLTTRGFSVDVSVRPAGGFLGGSENFWKASTTFEVGIPVYTTEDRGIHVLGFRGSFGWAEEFGDSDFVPLVERFFVGGTETLRGFDFQGVGSRDRNGDVTGGQAMWATSVEYRFPLYGDSLRGLFFWDAGTVGERLTDPTFRDTRMSVGFGFRIRIPFLGVRPFAIDFGFPIKKERYDDRRLVSFTISQLLF